MNSSLQGILDRLKGVRRNGSGWMALCPAHADKNPSLSVNVRDGKVLLHCFAGCSQEAVCEAAGLDWKDLFEEEKQKPAAEGNYQEVARYEYTDENGITLFQVRRMERIGKNGGKRKIFPQYRPDGKGGWLAGPGVLNGVRRVPYRLPEVVAAKSVLVVEGEKDCETARALGIVATCNSEGAGKWYEEHAEQLRGKHVSIIPDNDMPGRKHAEQVATSLDGKAASVAICNLPEGIKDVTDYLAMFSCESLRELIKKAPAWKAAAETPDSCPQPGAVLRCFSEIAPMPLQWLWPGRIPLGKLTLLIGDPGLGKSLLTADIAARVTCGKPFPDGATCEAGGVILLSAEDDAADTIRPRLDAAGTDVSRVHILEAVRVQLGDGSLTEKTFNIETDIAHLEQALRKHPDVRLVVIDPVSSYLGGTDSHSNAEVRGLLAPLAALAGKLGVAILCVTHLRKSAGAAVYRAMGSIAFAAAARSVWAVALDPEDTERRLLLEVKQNLSPNCGGLAFRIETQNNVPHLAWEPGTVALSANDVLAVDGSEGQSERKEAEEWLRDYLADGPAGAREVIAAAGHVGVTKTTLWRAATSLAIVKRKLGGRGAGWEWSLPDSKNPAPVGFKDSNPCYVDVDSLNSLTKQLKTKPDSGGENSKIPHVESLDPLESLPLADHAHSEDRNPPTAEDVHGTTKMSTPEGHTIASDGDTVCNSCAGRFRTVAGWRAHRGRCDKPAIGKAATARRRENR
jgi:putative DNA primase/helicase